MKTGTETAFLRQKGHSIVRNLILRERTFKYSYAKIRHSILHALVSEPLSCRNLLYRLRLIYDLSERALVSRVRGMHSDGLISSTGKTHCQVYALTQHGYVQYLEGLNPLQNGTKFSEEDLHNEN
jgi:hypothetical protein